MKTLIAWATGFIEADGCFHIDKHNRAIIAVTNNDREILEKIKTIFGFGCIANHKRKGTIVNKDYRTTKNSYQWRVVCRQARTVANLIFPFMVGKKKQQLLEQVEFWKIDC